MLRGCWPKVPAAGCANAALLNQVASLTNARRLQRRIADEIPELVAAAGANAGVVDVLPHRKRRAGLHLVDAGQLPVSEQAAHHAGRAAERQLVNVADDQHVGAVEIGDAVVALVAIRIRQDLGQRRSVVAQPRKRVGDVELETRARSGAGR